MKHKLFTLLIAVIVGVGTLFAEKVQIGDLYYNLDETNQTAEVTYQKQYSDANYQGLISVIIPNSLEYESVNYTITGIASNAFSGCKTLKTIVVPSSIASIGRQAFYSCRDLESIIVESNNAIYDSRNNCNAIIETATNTLVVGCMNTNIPNTVTSIGEYAFAACSKLTSIELPNSITSIGLYAFMFCSTLTSMTIPNSVTNIEQGVFQACSALRSVTIENGVTKIGHSMFYKCANLESVNIPTSVVSIDAWAFRDCVSLLNLTIPNSVTSIKVMAFDRVPNVIYFGNASGAPWGAKSINGYIDDWLVYSDNTKTNLLGCSAVASGTLNIPNSVTRIGDNAFSGCNELTTILLPNSITSVGYGAFEECVGLTEISIPDGVSIIESRTFYHCENLLSINLSASLMTIRNGAFSQCWNLKSISCEATTPPTLEDEVFYSVDKSIPLYVPAESIDLYKAADQWKDFTNILPIGGYPSLSLPIHIELKDNYGRWLNEAAISNEHDTAFFYSSSFDYSEYLVYAYKAEDNLWRLIGRTTPEYRFISWKDKDGKVLNQDTLCLYSSDTVTAVVSKQEYHLQVVPDNYMHGYIKAEYGSAGDTIISYGESINVTAIPREGYQFSNWSDWHTDNPRNIKILGDLYLTAIFDCKSYGGGWPSNLMDTITIERGESIVISNGITIYPTETGYQNDTLRTIYGCDSIVTHYVIVTENKFPVIFLNYNGKVLSRQYVRNGMGAEEPEVPAREGYTFTGWTTDIEHIVDTTYAIAVYDKIGGTLTYLSEEGDIIATENVDLHLPAAPIIAGKSFKGWLTESADAENGIVLRATYTSDNPTTHDDVTITPSSNSAYVIFPFITGALTYQLVIRDLFGNVVCKIMFSATGHLLGVAFAPSRNRTQQQATETTGFNFTVEGLDANTTYEYEFVANDETDEVIETLSGSFTTKAEMPTDNEQVNSHSAVRKYLDDGHLMIDANSHIFDTQGKMMK
jgi:uncharacterized repeat protein (TIGR02543 family)